MERLSGRIEMGKNKKIRILQDVITPQSLNIIDVEGKEIMVYAMKKMIEDLNNIDLLFASLDMPPEKVQRLRQFINNNKLRAQKVIWGLTVSRIKDAALESSSTIQEELEMHKKIMKQKEEYD